MNFKVFATLVFIISIVFILSIAIALVNVASWVTSGEAGADIGDFAGDVQKGYDEAKE